VLPQPELPGVCAAFIIGILLGRRDRASGVRGGMELEAKLLWRLWKALCCSVVLTLVGCVHAESDLRPYDEDADARAAIADALALSTASRPVLITFGANWCKDSRALEAHYQSPELAALLEQHFVLVRVDVGMFHRNLDIVEEYGNPIDKGIPAVVLLSPEGKLLYASVQGELASASRMSLARAVAFFSGLAEDGKPR